ncbi:hypothetical protein Hanom_Chr15g01364061 [Helianthus anomalus]
MERFKRFVMDLARRIDLFEKLLMSLSVESLKEEVIRWRLVVDESWWWFTVVVAMWIGIEI